MQPPAGDVSSRSTATPALPVVGCSGRLAVRQLRLAALGAPRTGWSVLGHGQPRPDDWTRAHRVADALTTGAADLGGAIAWIGLWGARRHGVGGGGQGDLDLAVLLVRPDRRVVTPATALSPLVAQAQARAAAREALLARVPATLVRDLPVVDLWVGFADWTLPVGTHTAGLDAYVLDDVRPLVQGPAWDAPLQWTGTPDAWARVAAAQRLLGSLQALRHVRPQGAWTPRGWATRQLERAAILVAQATQLRQGAPEGVARAWRGDWARQSRAALADPALALVEPPGLAIAPAGQVERPWSELWAWRDRVAEAQALVATTIGTASPEIPRATWAGLWRGARHTAAQPWLAQVFAGLTTPAAVSDTSLRHAIGGAWALLSGHPSLPLSPDDPWWARHDEVAALGQTPRRELATAAEALLDPWLDRSGV